MYIYVNSLCKALTGSEKDCTKLTRIGFSDHNYWNTVTQTERPSLYTEAK